MKNRYTILLGTILAIGVIIAIFIGGIYANTCSNSRIIPIIKLDTSTLEEQGYICTYQEKEYELKYIENEGWFIIDHNWVPYPLMYRLDHWLNEKE